MMSDMIDSMNDMLSSIKQTLLESEQGRDSMEKTLGSLDPMVNWYDGRVTALTHAVKMIEIEIQHQELLEARNAIP